MNNNVNKMTMFWLSGLSMLGFLATDMYLPAFEIIRADLGTDESLIGLSLSLFLLGMAIGQLVYGPLSDRIGRKKVLLGGMLLFILATLVLSIAPSIEIFLGARFVQALGACSGAVIWQAVVIDRYEGKLAERIFATVMPLVALSPALAPLVGAGLEHSFGWRSIFIVLVVIGVILAIATMRQSESLPANTEHEHLLVQLRRDYALILKSKKFIGNMLIFAACSAAFFAYLTGSPFIMASMGYSGGDIGLSYLPQTIAFILGGYGCRALLAHYSANRILPWILFFFAISIIIMFTLSYTNYPTTIWPILIPFCLMAFTSGAIYPIVINAALVDFKSCGATAAGLLNFLQTMFSFIASSVVSTFAVNGLLIVTAVMLIQVLIVIIGLRLTLIEQKKTTQSLESSLCCN